MRILIAAAIFAAAGCASAPKARAPAGPYHATAPASRVDDDDLSGVTTLAPTAETGPYNADPLQKFGRGAPPR